MPSGALFGFIATGVTLAIFLWWTARELRRVERPDDEPPSSKEAGVER
ncbi:MAG: hypothetical protein KY469_11535 [Actinobacteria bacterium]|nr:hypothetical protein [Actinomycetota bacterium]